MLFNVIEKLCNPRVVFKWFGVGTGYSYGWMFYHFFCKKVIIGILILVFKMNLVIDVYVHAFYNVMIFYYGFRYLDIV